SSPMRRLQDFEAIGRRHPEVRENQVERARGERVDRQPALRATDDVVPLREHIRKKAQHERIVIDREDSHVGRSTGTGIGTEPLASGPGRTEPAKGSASRHLVPPPSTAMMLRRPRLLSRKRRAVISPRPAPETDGTGPRAAMTAAEI